MPKVKDSPIVHANKQLVAKIYGGIKAEGITTEVLARSARISRSALYKRVKEPERFELGELRRISSKLNIPLKELLSIPD